MRIRDASDFGAVARQRRRDLGLSQEDVATKSGVTRQWLVRFEQGNAEVALSKAVAVFRQLGLTVRADPGETPDATQYDIPKVDAGRISLQGPIAAVTEFKNLLKQLDAEHD